IAPRHPAKKKKRRNLRGLEARIAMPLYARKSPEHMNVVRSVSTQDPDLARVLGNVLDVFLAPSRDFTQYELNATLGAIAWNASLLTPDATERFLEHFADQLPRDMDRDYFIPFLRVMCNEK